MNTEHESSENDPKSYPVLSIDAWADGEEGWNWNQWFSLPDRLPAELLSDDAKIIAWFIDRGMLILNADRVYIYDDQYNKVVCYAATHEPLFAVEYEGSF